MRKTLTILMLAVILIGGVVWVVTHRTDTLPAGFQGDVEVLTTTKSLV